MAGRAALETGAPVHQRGTVWSVTVSPTPDEVDFWASGRVIATDDLAPYETPLDLEPGDYKLGFPATARTVSKNAETTETGDGTGIVARVTVVDNSPAPTGDTAPPTPPEALRVVTAEPTSLSMTWSPSTDNMGRRGLREVPWLEPGRHDEPDDNQLHRPLMRNGVPGRCRRVRCRREPIVTFRLDCYDHGLRGHRGALGTNKRGGWNANRH